MQQQLTTKGKLLNTEGELCDRGYSTSLILEYDREDIQASKWRIKEWDYYLITTSHYGVALTIADNSYMGLVSISLLDFKNKTYKTKTHMIPFTFGKLKLPHTSKTGDIRYVDHQVEVHFYTHKKERRLRCYMKEFEKDKPFECEFILSDEPKESIVTVTPFKEDKKAFYYNQKIIGMCARGYVKAGKQFLTFRQNNARALLDWGRGVWPYKSHWYWGAAMGTVDNEEIGFNIGCGFGDTNGTSENCFFYKGLQYKLEAVKAIVPKQDEVGILWKFHSSDGRFEMEFKPIVNRKDYHSYGIILSDQQQVFGKYTGKVILDDGTEIKVRDLLGFAESVRNKW
ncbi:DUF2804 domain-containing protein [Niameybacter massiliensis]|uniref:DUF2804 domain-containing protein n=1 Tax=Niameybacter massiliensis TaxID=1658108 RepID=UPI0006B65CDC|nr:DUF2804 domain-containing protein [Niameybacter massiliensis]